MTTTCQHDQWMAKRLPASKRIQAKKSHPSQMWGIHSFDELGRGVVRACSRVTGGIDSFVLGRSRWDTHSARESRRCKGILTSSRAAGHWGNPLTGRVE